jgi:hypothetical protein
MSGRGPAAGEVVQVASTTLPFEVRRTWTAPAYKEFTVEKRSRR